MKHSFLALCFATICIAGCSPENTNISVEEKKTTVELTKVEVQHTDSHEKFEMNWETTPAQSPVSIYVSADPEASIEQSVLLSSANTAGSFVWDKAASDKRQYFSFVTENGFTVRSTVRLLPLKGGRNFRDLGGYKTEDGKTVKWGKVYRSGTMHNITDEDYKYLSSLGIKTICDFRDLKERDDEPTQWAAGEIDYKFFADPTKSDPRSNPMFAALLNPESTPEDVKNAMAAGYSHIAKDEKEGYIAMFDELAAGRLPLAFNCSAGKDRAGTAAALILTALGVPHETVVHDYSLSDDYVDYMAEFLGPEQRAKVEADPNHPYAFLFQLPAEKIAPLLSSEPVFIESSFKDLADEYGSVINFIRNELKVTDEELSMIRSSLLE